MFQKSVSLASDQPAQCFVNQTETEHMPVIAPVVVDVNDGAVNTIPVPDADYSTGAYNSMQESSAMDAEMSIVTVKSEVI